MSVLTKDAKETDMDGAYDIMYQKTNKAHNDGNGAPSAQPHHYRFLNTH